MKLKWKKEKGVTGVDIATGIIIFIVSSTTILAMYYEIFIQIVAIRLHEIAVAAVTEVFEGIDAASYDEVNQYKTSATGEINEGIVYDLIRYSDLKSKTKTGKDIYTTTLSIEKYSETSENHDKGLNDYLIKVSIFVKYQIGDKERSFQMNKIKIKEP